MAIDEISNAFPAERLQYLAIVRSILGGNEFEFKDIVKFQGLAEIDLLLAVEASEDDGVFVLVESEQCAYSKSKSITVEVGNDEMSVLVLGNIEHYQHISLGVLFGVSIICILCKFDYFIRKMLN